MPSLSGLSLLNVGSAHWSMTYVPIDLHAQYCKILVASRRGAGIGGVSRQYTRSATNF
ncbi:hypothetical protein AGMMS49992_02240 [Clostridia bacterium]|nr:hypothetical protein AGMMS49992_02240 [Clostridia bacterium]